MKLMVTLWAWLRRGGSRMNGRASLTWYSNEARLNLQLGARSAMNREMRHENVQPSRPAITVRSSGMIR
jgi:hypothetical protein